MKKIIKKLVITLSLITLPNFSYSLGPDKDYEENKENFLNTLLPLIECINQGKLKIIETNIPNRSGIISTFYSYKGEDSAIQALNNYFDKYTKLRLNLYKNSIGNGFIIGALASILNRASVKTERHKLIGLIGIIISTGFTCYENQQKGPLWAFVDGSYEFNLFSNTNIHTFGRIATTSAMFMFSFLGINYCFEKQEQMQEIDKSNWIEKTKTKLNEFKSYSQSKVTLFKNQIQEKLKRKSL